MLPPLTTGKKKKDETEKTSLFSLLAVFTVASETFIKAYSGFKHNQNTLSS